MRRERSCRECRHPADFGPHHRLLSCRHSSLEQCRRLAQGSAGRTIQSSMTAAPRRARSAKSSRMASSFSGECPAQRRHNVDVATSLTHREFGTPRCGVQGFRRIDMVCCPSVLIVRRIAGTQQLAHGQLGFGPVDELPSPFAVNGTGSSGAPASVMSSLPCRRLHRLLRPIQQRCRLPVSHQGEVSASILVGTAGSSVHTVKG